MQRRASHGSAVWMSLLVALLGAGSASADDAPFPERAWDAAAGNKLATHQVHSLAMDADGTVWAWGNNQSGQLGDGTGNARLTPIRVPGLQDVEAVANG